MDAATHDKHSGKPYRARKQDLASEDVDNDDLEESRTPPERTSKSILQVSDEPGDLLEDTVPGETRIGQPPVTAEALEAPHHQQPDKITAQTSPAMADPQAAAAHRSNARREMNQMPAAEKEITKPSIAGEEANPPEFYNEVGMPMEPFNLDQEREDGFFTAGGGYVERNQADSRDAWIESLEDQGEIQGADSDATVAKPARPPGNQPEVSEPPGLSGAELSRERDLLVAALAPSETVAEALRRLQDADRGMFERVTEAAEALVDSGDIGLYEAPREVLQRQQDQAPAAAAAPRTSHPPKRPRTGEAPLRSGPTEASSSKPRDPEEAWGTSAWGATASELTFGSLPGPDSKLDTEMAEPLDVTDAVANGAAATAAASQAPDHLVGSELDRVSASYAHPAATRGDKASDAVRHQCSMDHRGSEDMSAVSSAPPPRAPPPESVISPTMAQHHGSWAVQKQEAQSATAADSASQQHAPNQKHIHLDDEVALLAAARRTKPDTLRRTRIRDFLRYLRRLPHELLPPSLTVNACLDLKFRHIAGA
ncbi:hypothetical protein WJX84_002963 [Apatococcus fuscideae]|uniref:Uncharacterized protein n=1 Tax=Apatococcus fuscideae TaxID=2026836 RepID=A0AAW1T8N0_9CHLO